MRRVRLVTFGNDGVPGPGGLTPTSAVIDLYPADASPDRSLYSFGWSPMLQSRETRRYEISQPPERRVIVS